MNRKATKMAPSILCLMLIGFAVNVYADIGYGQLADLIKSLEAVEGRTVEDDGAYSVNERDETNDACVVKNVALYKPAVMSSIYIPNATADLAVDGITEQRFYGDNWGVEPFCFHTDESTNNWWHVDLGAVFVIEKLKLFNRIDCCGERASELKILVGEDLKKMRQVGFVEEMESTKTIPLHNAVGRYVKIEQGITDKFTLCEVEVFGKPESCNPCKNGGTLQEGTNKCDCVEKIDHMFRGDKCEDVWVKLPSPATYELIPKY